MKTTTEDTRSGRRIVHGVTSDGRVMRLSVGPQVTDWYFTRYASVWPRRIIQDFDRTGALDPQATAMHSDKSPALMVLRDDREPELDRKG